MIADRGGTLGEKVLLDVEVMEDGRVRLFCGRATDDIGGELRFMDMVVAGLIMRVFETARAVAETAGFRGEWGFGVALENVAGSVSHQAAMNAMFRAAAFGEKRWRRTKVIVGDDLADPAGAASKLTGPLLRAFSSPVDPTNI